MANGKFHMDAADGDASAGELIPLRPGGLPAAAGRRRERQSAARKTRMHICVSAALGRKDRDVSALRSR
jgi:hypothetical protein